MPKGPTSIPVEVKTSSVIPPSLANVDVHIDAVDQNGESVICLDVHTAAKEELARSAGEGCCLPSGGFLVNESYSLELDDLYEQIPTGALCDFETTGFEAVS